jgi:hypothetical protein
MSKVETDQENALNANSLEVVNRALDARRKVSQILGSFKPNQKAVIKKWTAVLSNLDNIILENGG